MTKEVTTTSSHHPELGTPPAFAGATATTRPARDAASEAAQLVRRAAAGDKSAWEGLVDKYSRLIWAMTRDVKLSEVDAADVVQATWLRLLEHIHRIEHPERISSWLATTARHECLRHLAARKRVVFVSDHDDTFTDTVAQPEVDERILAGERAAEVRAALAQLPSRHQQLMALLMADPPVSYQEISTRLGAPVGSIGPTRGRALERLRLILAAG